MAKAGTGDLAPGRFAAGLAAVATGALAVRVAFVVVVAPKVPALGDASAYHLLAEQLAHGRGYIRPFDALLLHLRHPTAEYPPLFPLLLSIPARLGAHSVEQQRVFTSFVGTVTVVLVGLLGRRVASARAGLVAAALAAVYPMLFLADATLMAESLYVALVAALLLCAYRAHAEPTARWFAATGALVGLATLTRAEGAVLGTAVVVGLVLRAPGLGARARLGRLAVAGLVGLVVVAPWTIRNAIRFHRLVPVSNNVATLVDGANCDATYHGELLGLWRETFSQPAQPAPGAAAAAPAAAAAAPQARACFEGFDVADPHFDEARVARDHLYDGAGYARRHLGSLPEVAAVRVLRTWALYAPGQQVGFESLEGRPRAWQWRGTEMFWVLAALALGGAAVLVRRRRFLWPLAATAVTVTVVAAATYGQQRFRIAAEPAVLVLAAVALVELPAAARRRAGAS